MKSPFHLTLVLPYEEVCLQVIPTQTISRVMAHITQKYSLACPEKWVMFNRYKAWKMTLEESLEDRRTLESIGLNKSCEITIEQID